MTRRRPEGNADGRAERVEKCLVLGRVRRGRRTRPKGLKHHDGTIHTEPDQMWCQGPGMSIAVSSAKPIAFLRSAA
jgi:hypothetical protein